MTDDERLSELFGRAIALGAAERVALVDELRADEPALATELAALLAIGARRLEAPDESTLAPRGTDVDVAAATAVESSSPPGRVAPAVRTRLEVPGYRLLEILGEGAIGTVYAGEQDAPRRPVAIKVLHAASSAALARFLGEAEIMARLDHPGIAKVVEAGLASGRPYFVMERVDGVTLDVHVRTRRPPLAERLALVAGLCDAVHHAHVKGVIHRDLKPSNVMVRSDGRVAVLDFGVARLAPIDGESVGDTRAGELIGTPLYMSPEQARLRPDEVDARSDVYALGVLLYELCADTLPYDVRGQALPDVARAICHDPPVPLGRRRRDLGGDLEAICDKALAKDPEHRYQSAAALADDVRAHLAGGTVSARAPGALEQVRRFARRQPAVAAAVMAAVTAGALFAVVVTWLWLAAREARRAAERERAHAIAARDELELRNNQLLLDRARGLLASDPSAALTALAAVGERGVDPDEAWAIADEAAGRGVAAVAAVHGDEARWLEAVPGTGALVSAGYDGLVAWWQPGAPARPLWRASGRAYAARPSPDGARIALAADGAGVRLLDRRGVEVAPPLTDAEAPDVTRLMWAADGHALAAGDDHGGVRLWTAERGWGPRRDGPADVEIQALAFADDGRAVVAGDEDGGVWWWSTAGGPPAASVALGAQVVALAADGRDVAALAADGVVHRWRFDGGLRPVGTIATGVPAKAGALAGVATVVIGGADGRVVVVDGERARALAGHGAPVRAVAVTADGRWAATAGEDGSLVVDDLERDRTLELHGHRQRVRHLAFVDGGAALLAADSAGELRRWELSALAPTVLVGHHAPVDALVAGPAAGEAALASVDTAGAIWRWRLVDGVGEPVGVHPARVTGLAFVRAGDGRSVVISAGADGALRWWRTDGVVERALGAGVTALAARPDGAEVAAATTAGDVAVFAGDGTPGPVLRAHPGGADAVVYSPDGAVLATAGEDRMVRVWSTAEPGRAPRVLGPADDDVRHLAFTPDGRTLLAAGDDGRLRAWSMTADGPPRVLAEHGVAIVALELVDGGATVVTTGRDQRRITTALVAGVTPGHAPVSRPWLALPGTPARLALGRADGTILVRPSAPRSLAELRAWLASHGAAAPR